MKVPSTRPHSPASIQSVRPVSPSITCIIILIVGTLYCKDGFFTVLVLPAEQTDGGRVNKIAAASYLAKCYLNLAWGDGYEATTGESHINEDYMQKVVTYTNEVTASAGNTL